MKKGIFYERRRKVKCGVCDFELELFYSWSDYDAETKLTEQREIECPNCHESVFAQVFFGELKDRVASVAN